VSLENEDSQREIFAADAGTGDVDAGTSIESAQIGFNGCDLEGLWRVTLGVSKDNANTFLILGSFHKSYTGNRDNGYRSNSPRPTAWIAVWTRDR
jgi:hypothetical protein